MMTRADLFRSQYQSTLAREETRGMFDEAANNIEDLKKMVLNDKKNDMADSFNHVWCDIKMVGWLVGMI